MASRYEFEGEEQKKRLEDMLARLHGFNGEWNSVNTLVFIFTSFTTVGYGNHPSLVRVKPPCQYPCPTTITDDPFSILLPDALQPSEIDLVKAAGQSAVSSSETQPAKFVQPPEFCFHTYGRSEPRVSECWLVSDERSIFDFGDLLWFQDYHNRTKSAMNFTTSQVDDLFELELPGLRRSLSQMGVRRPVIPNATQYAADPFDMAWRGEAFGKIREECDVQLEIWRAEENKKDNAKIFTILFIIVGIGLLGIVVGTLGEYLMAAMKSVFDNVEMALDAATLNQMNVATGDKKGIAVATAVMLIVLTIGTVVYAQLDKMRFVDALYFTVVTATTVGFGDYVPTEDAAKVRAYIRISTLAVTIVPVLFSANLNDCAATGIGRCLR